MSTEQFHTNDEHDVDVGGKHSNKGKYTFPSFDIATILKITIPKITIKKLPEDIIIENTPTFKIILDAFNEAFGIHLSPEELLYSRSSFHAFMHLVETCEIKRYLIISEACEDDYIRSKKRLRDKYTENLRSLERYYDEIIRTVYRPREFSKKDKWVRDEMDHFEQAYTFTKASFQKDKRESGERTFEHPKGVMEIILREFPNPNIKKIILALLHDVQETFPEYADVVRKFYGNYIADGVNELSKKDWRIYLTEAERQQCGEDLEQQNILFNEVRKFLVSEHAERAFTSADKILETEIVAAMDEGQLQRYRIIEKNIKPYMKRAKERRDNDYFGHLDTLDDNGLDVKLADRIHNLRDNSGVEKEKKIRTIEVTKKYFLHIAKKRNPTAYRLMMDEIEKFETSVSK